MKADAGHVGSLGQLGKNRFVGPQAASRPLDLVLPRLEILHGAPPKMRARCPVHGSRGGTLAIGESASGAVLLRCFAGCSIDAIVGKIGLTVAQLFPTSDAAEMRRRSAERAELQRRYRTTPKAVVRDMVAREIARKRAELLQHDGFVRPLRADDLNAIRRHVASVLGVANPAPLQPFAWEGYPGRDSDPLWPELFARGMRWAIDERDRQQLGDIISESSLRFRAASLAAQWLREASAYVEPPMQPDLAQFFVPMCLHCGYCHRPGTPHPFEREQRENQEAMARLRGDAA